MTSAAPLIGIAVAIAIIVILAAMTVMSSASAGLMSAVTQIASFLALIGLGTAIGVMVKAFGGGR